MAPLMSVLGDVRLCCPVCERELLVVRRPGVQTYHCATCNGRAITMSVLRRFAPKKYVDDVWNTMWSRSTPSERECASCEKQMVGFVLEVREGIIGARGCRSCQLVWFDISELTRFLVDDPDMRTVDGHVSPEDRADFTKTQEVHLAEADDGTWSAVDLLLLFS